MNKSIIGGAILALAMLGACQRTEPVGPAQKAGAAIDEAGEKVADKLQEGVDKADEAAKKL